MLTAQQQRNNSPLHPNLYEAFKVQLLLCNSQIMQLKMFYDYFIRSGPRVQARGKRVALKEFNADKTNKIWKLNCEKSRFHANFLTQLSGTPVLGSALGKVTMESQVWRLSETSFQTRVSGVICLICHEHVHLLSVPFLNYYCNHVSCQFFEIFPREKSHIISL